MSMKIPACNINGKYTLLFVTVERDRNAPKHEQRKKLIAAVNSSKVANKIKLAITSEEVSDNDYYHHHLIVQFATDIHIKKFWRHLVKAMKYDKPDNKDISVWMGYLPKGSTGNADSLRKYLDEKKYKSSAPDPDGSCTFIDLMCCSFCGANKPVQKNRIVRYRPTQDKIQDFVEEYWSWNCLPHPKFGHKICINHPYPLMAIF